MCVCVCVCVCVKKNSVRLICFVNGLEYQTCEVMKSYFPF